MNPINAPVSRNADRSEFCVCRVLENCALVRLRALNELLPAKRYMRRIASHVPGSYVVFSYRSKRIISKLVSHAAA
jgi:hypothetical protein